ncbi:Putative POM121-like protein 1 [Tupaia chinensis]|uniref:Putative POM121-like protein 1 n=1 Tax=Tupaia chinensis TaxID=246437 RepID=L9J9J3_TUPCH|nr:Putative POM121-like protein 1 [Tupaia chinensis]
MGRAGTPPNCPPPADSSRPRRRKFCLLPRRRGPPLELPPPPLLGFRVTVEDLDGEKKEAFQRLNRFLMGEDEAKDSETSSSSQLSCSVPPPATGPILPSAASPAPSSGDQMENSQSPAASQGPAAPLDGPAVALPAQPGSMRKHSTPGPLCFSQGGPGSSPGSLPTAQSTLLLPASSPPSGLDWAGPSHRVLAPCPAPGMALTVQGQTPSPAPMAAVGVLPALLLQSSWGSSGNGGDGGPGRLSASASASADFGPIFQSTPSTSRVETPSPMCVDPPDFPSESLPPLPGPSAPHTTGLPGSAPGFSCSPFMTSPAGWAS